MREKQKGFAPIILLIIIAIIVITFTAYYFIRKNYSTATSVFNQAITSVNEENPQKIILAQTEQAKLKVAMETKILNDLVQKAETQKKTVELLKARYSGTLKIINKNTDTLFKNPESTKPEIKITLKDKVVQDAINANRKQVESVLDVWKTELDNYTNSSVTLTSLINTTQQSINSIQNYLVNLQAVVDTLTVSNSNATQKQIDAYQLIVDNAIEEMQKVVNDLSSNPINDPFVVSSPIVTPVQIQNQQNVVTQAQEALQVLVTQQNQDETTNTTVDANSTNSNTSSDIIPPTATLTSPHAGAVLSYVAFLSASANDASGISKVEFYSDSTLVGTDTVFPYSMSWDTSTVADGVHQLSARAYDTLDNIKVSALVQVSTDNGNNSSNGINAQKDPELIEGANRLDP